VIDLHCHILPGVDDGPTTLEESVAMGRIAAEDGIATIVATPHVSDDYPTDPGEILQRVSEVNAAFAQAGVAVDVVGGAEVALGRLLDLDRPALESVCIGDGPYLLVEPPHGFVPDSLERLLFDLQVDGFRPVLAHVERCAGLASKPERIAELAERGMVCSITGASATGRFGTAVRKATRDLLRRGLVHDVASDAHSTRQRTPQLSAARQAVERDAAVEDAWAWLTQSVPAAVVAGFEVPQSPPARPEGGAWQKVVRAVRDSRPG
jgi:protein-tyrosine phosphatase